LGPEDRARALKIAALLTTFSVERAVLSGAQTNERRTALALQLVESFRRERYVHVIRERPLSARSADPEDDLFDPLRAALFHYAAGNIDEAFWLVFLSVHFGKHLKDGWRLARDVYRGNGGNKMWTWARVSNSPKDFGKWLAANEAKLRSGKPRRRFGNHRKYESLRVDSKRGTAEVFKSYVEWIGPNVGHRHYFQQLAGNPPASEVELFDRIYQAMDAVISFGRTGKFDFLTMLAKLGFLRIAPGKPYFEGATGPLFGARLLFEGDRNGQMSASALSDLVVELGHYLGASMQVMEDALCNWQKSPDAFVPFRG
jgi:hypothetical protein